MTSLPVWNTEITSSFLFMEVFRISKSEFSQNLTSSGAANRWNLQGQHVIYVGTSRSLSTLELVVRRNIILPELSYKMMVISIADNDDLVNQIKLSDLPKNWRTLAAYSTLQRIGSRWYQNQESLLLKVPSAVIPHEYNYAINTKHPDYEANIKLIRLEDYYWDGRLL